MYVFMARSLCSRYVPWVRFLRTTMVRTYVHLLSGWMCALCSMYAYVLFVHYMVYGVLYAALHTVCMYVHSMLSVCTRGLYVLYAIWMFCTVLMYVLSEYVL